MEFAADARAVWTEQERAEIAADHDRRAAFMRQQASELTAAGYHRMAAEALQAAQKAKDVAVAARTSNSALARLY